MKAAFFGRLLSLIKQKTEERFEDRYGLKYYRLGVDSVVEVSDTPFTFLKTPHWPVGRIGEQEYSLKFIMAHSVPSVREVNEGHPVKIFIVSPTKEGRLVD